VLGWRGPTSTTGKGTGPSWAPRPIYVPPALNVLKDLAVPLAEAAGGADCFATIRGPRDRWAGPRFLHYGTAGLFIVKAQDR
jgi:hypothetical protein